MKHVALLLALTSFCVSHAVGSTKSNTKPNIIFILADDLDSDFKQVD